MHLETWVVDELSKFLGIDDETLKTNVVPYLWTIETPDALSEHLMSMLGTSSDALAFIERFTVRRFQQQQQEQQKQKQQISKDEPVPQQQPVEPQHFPSLPVSESGSRLDWPANVNVYMKKGNEGNYYSGKLQKSKAGKGPQKNDSANASPSTSSSTVTPEQSTEKKKKKKKNEMTLETALKELDIRASEGKGKRRPCQCQATKHPLLTVAPNCLNCGKIICTLEGVGPCTFCGTPVLSKEQMVALVAEAKKKRAEQKRLQNQQIQQRKAKAAQTPAVAYAAKVSGDIIPRMAYQEPTFDDAKEEENRRRAEAQKEKLLEFQRTSAKRTTVIDQASDFMLPTDQFNPWLTPQERAMQMKKQQANLQKLQSRDSTSKRRVLTIDIHSKQVSVAEASSSESDSEPEEYPEVQPVQQKPTEKQDGSAGTYASNPLLKGIAPPKFVGKHSEGKGQRRRRKQRVQYDEEELYDDYQYASSIADNRDISVEPVTCKVDYQQQ